MLLVFNAIIGFWEELKAANALEALKSRPALDARADDGGTWQFSGILPLFAAAVVDDRHQGLATLFVVCCIVWIFHDDRAKLAEAERFGRATPRHRDFFHTLSSLAHPQAGS